MRQMFHVAAAPLIGFAALALIWGAHGALMPAYVAKAGLNDADLGYAILVSSLVGGLFLFVAPRIISGLGRWKLAAPISLFVPSAILMVRADGFVTFVGGLSLAALASSLMDVVLNARLSELERRHETPLMNGVHGMFAAFMTVSTLGVGVLRDVGLSSVTIILGISGCLMAATVYLAKRPMNAVIQTEDSISQEKISLSWLVLLAGAGVCFLAICGEQAGQNWSAIYLERDMQVRPGLSALAPALIAATMALGRFAAQAVAHRFTPSVLLVGAGVVSAIGFIGVALVPQTAAALPPVYACFALVGLGISVMEPTAYSLIGRRVSPDQLPHAMSRLSMLGGTGFVLGPWAIGAVAQSHGLSTAFAVAGAAMLVVVPLALPLRTPVEAVR